MLCSYVDSDGRACVAEAAVLMFKKEGFASMYSCAAHIVPHMSSGEDYIVTVMPEDKTTVTIAVNGKDRVLPFGKVSHLQIIALACGGVPCQHMHLIEERSGGEMHPTLHFPRWISGSEAFTVTCGPPLAVAADVLKG